MKTIKKHISYGAEGCYVPAAIERLKEKGLVEVRLERPKRKKLRNPINVCAPFKCMKRKGWLNGHNIRIVKKRLKESISYDPMCYFPDGLILDYMRKNNIPINRRG